MASLYGESDGESTAWSRLFESRTGAWSGVWTNLGKGLQFGSTNNKEHISNYFDYNYYNMDHDP